MRDDIDELSIRHSPVSESMTCVPIVSVDRSASKKSLCKDVTTVFTVKNMPDLKTDFTMEFGCAASPLNRRGGGCFNVNNTQNRADLLFNNELERYVTSGAKPSGFY